MTSVAEAFVNIRPDSKNFGNELENSISPSVKRIAGLIAGAFAFDKLVDVGKSALKVAADFQQTTIAFEGLFGSGVKAQGFLTELQRFAAKTPFEFTGLAKSAQQLLAVGFSASDVIPTMEKLGNVAASLGAGEEQISLVVRALGQMKGKGKVSAEEINQIAENLPGFNAYAAIAAKRGTTIAKVMEDMAKGAVPASEGVAAIIEGMERFPGAAGAMERQSKTLNGVISTLRDNLKLVAIDFITPKLPALSRSVEKFGQLVKEVFEGDLRSAAVSLGLLFNQEEDSKLTAAFTRIGDAAKALAPIIRDVLAAHFDSLAKTVGGVVIGISFAVSAFAGMVVWLDKVGVPLELVVQGVLGLVTALLALKAAEAAATGINSLTDHIAGIGRTARESTQEIRLLADRVTTLSGKTVKIAQSGAETAAQQVLTLKDSIDRLKDRAVEVTANVKTQAEDLSRQGADAARQFATSFGGALAGTLSGPAIGTAIRAALPAIGAALATVGTVIVGAISSPIVLAGLAAAAVGAALYFAYQFRDSIGGFFTETLPQALSTAFKALGNFLTSTLPNLIGQAIGMAVAGALVIFIGLPVRMIAELVKAIPGILEAFQNIGASIQGAVGRIILDVVVFFAKLPIRIADALASAASFIGGVFVDIGTAIAAAVTGAIEAVVLFFAKLPMRVVGAIRNLPELFSFVIERVKERGIFIISDMAVAIVRLLGELAVNAGRKAGELLTSFVGVVSQLPVKTQELFARVLASAVDIFNRVIRFIADLPLIQAVAKPLGALVDGIREGWNRVNDMTGGALNRWVGIVSDSVSRGISFVQSIPSRIISGLGDLGGLLYNAGRNLIQGLINGITSRIDAVGDAVGRIANKVKGFFPGSPVKEGPLAGIHEPFFAGQKLAKGIAAGIESAESVVAAAMEVIAGVAAKPLPVPAVASARGGAGPLQTSSTSGNTYVLNVQTVRSEADIQEQFRRLEWAAGRL